MAHSSTRLILYALITSIEDDLRALLATYIGQQLSTEVVLGENLYGEALERFARDNEEITGTPALGDLLPYVDFGDLIHLFNSHRQ